MREVFETLGELISQNQTGALVTVVRTKGPTPRKSGAKLLVLASGEIIGTVGGGCVEAEVWQQARVVMKTGQPQLLVSNLTAETAGDSGMICGGVMEMFIEPIGRASDESAEVLVPLIEARKRGEPVALATVIRSPGGRLKPATKLLVKVDGTAVGPLVGDSLAAEVAASGLTMIDEGAESRLVRYSRDNEPEAEEIDVYIEIIRHRPTTIVVGAGHVGLHVARFAKGVGFEVIVLDDRADFANPERFPEVDEVICGNMGETLAGMTFGANSFIVLVTRGHKEDETALRQVVNSDAAYIGMIGSKVRVRTVKERLVRDGFAAERVEAIHSPIGLPIGAETPEEIALAIVAEIVSVRRGADPRPTGN